MQTQTTSEAIFTIHNVYLKDLSYEAPQAPHIFQAEWQPKLDFDMQTGSQLLNPEEGIHEVVLHFTVTVKLTDDKVAFLIDIQQAGIFTIKGMTEEFTKRILGTACPTALFPYVREAVSNLVTRGGFPQLVLPMVNFDAMYEQYGKSGQQPMVEDTTA
jgi:preprotein translocase subunit SecB